MISQSKQLQLFSNAGADLSDEVGSNSPSFDASALFDAWVTAQNPLFRRSTIKVYRALWSTFLVYQKDHTLAWDEIDPVQIKRFLASLEDAKRPQRERYQALLERMFSEIAQIARGLPDNPARKAYVAVPKGQDWRDAQDNSPTQFLTPLDRIILRERLIAVSHTLRGAGLRPAGQWRLARDTAIVALLFACGIKPAEALVLSVNCLLCNEQGRFIDTSAYHGLTAHERTRDTTRDPNADATHAFSGQEHGATRQVPVPDWTYEILSQWLDIRAQAPTGARQDLQRLFPGARVLHAANATTVMNPATLARVVAKWGQNYASLVLTPQRLRNAYGSTLIEAGMAPQAIGKLMGYAQGSVSALRLSQAWLQWCEKN